MKKSPKILIAGMLVVALAAGGILLAQSSDDEQSNDVIVQNSEQPFSLGVDLETLDQGAYEGWVVKGEEKLSFGRFNTDEMGDIVGELDFTDINPEEGDTIAISIEPENDVDPEPSETIVLSGEFTNGRAELGFPVDVNEFSGQFILATPTTTTEDDETAGVWFTTTGSDASLNIPVAPAGWAYEGWAVVDGTPYSTGLFTDPAEADFFDGYSGPEGAPNKPGEDFVANLAGAPLDLRGSTIVVSIEPFQDGVDPTGDNPAQVKPLTAQVAGDAIDHSAFDLTLGVESVPSGIFQI